MELADQETESTEILLVVTLLSETKGGYKGLLLYTENCLKHH